MKKTFAVLLNKIILSCLLQTESLAIFLEQNCPVYLKAPIIVSSMTDLSLTILKIMMEMYVTE